MKAAYLRIANTSHSRWAKDLFHDVTIHVNGGDVLWIIGPNGTGKSTLMNILSGELAPDHGTREIKWTLWMVTQWMDTEWMKTVWDYLLWKNGKEDREALVALGKSGGDEIGLTDKLHVLSWWQRTKVRLAKCLIDEVDILLLDEPTNHLDHDAVQSLQGMIRRWHGPVFVVSHDRRFLDAVCTHLADLRYGMVEHYTWNYTSYMEERSIRAQKQLQDFKLQERKRKAMEIWLHKMRERASFYASPRRGKLLKSREKHYTRTFKDQVRKPTEQRAMQMSVWWKTHDRKRVLQISEWGIGHRSQVLYEIADMKVYGEDRILISWANGSGKSTLLNFLLRAYDDASLTQRVQRWVNVRIGRMSQLDVQKYDDYLVMKRCHELFPQTRNESMIMTKLASAGIPLEDVIKKMHQLSYWQRVKIRFIQLMSQAYECLILDEPTNHLDIDTRESLEAMLVNYEWALIVVSHDQWFVEKIAINREWKIEEGLMMEVE